MILSFRLHSVLSPFSTQGFKVYKIVKAKNNLNYKSNNAKTREQLMKQEGSRIKTHVSTYFLLEIEKLENRTCRFGKGLEKVLDKALVHGYYF